MSLSTMAKLATVGSGINDFAPVAKRHGVVHLCAEVGEQVDLAAFDIDAHGALRGGFGRRDRDLLCENFAAVG